MHVGRFFITHRKTRASAMGCWICRPPTFFPVLLPSLPSVHRIVPKLVHNQKHQISASACPHTRAHTHPHWKIRLERWCWKGLCKVSEWRSQRDLKIKSDSWRLLKRVEVTHTSTPGQRYWLDGCILQPHGMPKWSRRGYVQVNTFRFLVEIVNLIIQAFQKHKESCS